MEEVDIYSDLPVFDFNKEFEKVQSECAILNEETIKLNLRIEELTKQIDKFKSQNHVLQVNISILLKTARKEIQRKDDLVALLRKKVRYLETKPTSSKKDTGPCVATKYAQTDPISIEKPEKKNTTEIRLKDFSNQHNQPFHKGPIDRLEKDNEKRWRQRNYRKKRSRSRSRSRSPPPPSKYLRTRRGRTTQCRRHNLDFRSSKRSRSRSRSRSNEHRRRSNVIENQKKEKEKDKSRNSKKANDENNDRINEETHLKPEIPVIKNTPSLSVELEVGNNEDRSHKRDSNLQEKHESLNLIECPKETYNPDNSKDEKKKSHDVLMDDGSESEEGEIVSSSSENMYHDCEEDFNENISNNSTYTYRTVFSERMAARARIESQKSVLQTTKTEDNGKLLDKRAETSNDIIQEANQCQSENSKSKNGSESPEQSARSSTVIEFSPFKFNYKLTEVDIPPVVNRRRHMSYPVDDSNPKNNVTCLSSVNLPANTDTTSSLHSIKLTTSDSNKASRAEPCHLNKANVVEQSNTNNKLNLNSPLQPVHGKDEIFALESSKVQLSSNPNADLLQKIEGNMLRMSNEDSTQNVPTVCLPSRPLQLTDIVSLSENSKIPESSSNITSSNPGLNREEEHSELNMSISSNENTQLTLSTSSKCIPVRSLSSYKIPKINQKVLSSADPTKGSELSPPPMNNDNLPTHLLQQVEVVPSLDVYNIPKLTKNEMPGANLTEKQSELQCKAKSKKEDSETVEKNIGKETTEGSDIELTNSKITNLANSESLKQSEKPLRSSRCSSRLKNKETDNISKGKETTSSSINSSKVLEKKRSIRPTTTPKKNIVSNKDAAVTPNKLTVCKRKSTTKLERVAKKSYVPVELSKSSSSEIVYDGQKSDSSISPKSRLAKDLAVSGSDSSSSDEDDYLGNFLNFATDFLT